MASVDRSVTVRLRADVNEFAREMGVASKALDGVAKSGEEAGRKSGTAMQRLAQNARDNREAWSNAGGFAATAGAAWTAFNAVVAKTGIEYNTLQQTSRAALRVLTGGAEQANAQMDRLDAFARTSPFAKDVFIRAQQQMLGFGIESQKVIPYLSVINDTVAGIGGSNQTISEISLIMSQISAASKITAVDLMQFAQRGVDAAEIIGSQMGRTGAQIRDDITAGTLDAQEALDALAAGMSERFGGASDAVKDSMTGAVDRLKAAFRDLSASFMESAVGPEGGGWLVSLTNAAADLLRKLEEIPGPVKNAIGFVSGLGGAALIAAGGFMRLAPRVIDTWDGLKQIGIITPSVSRNLGLLGRSAGTAGLAFLALQGVNEILKLIGDAANAAVPSVEYLEGTLNRIASGANVDASRLLRTDDGGMWRFQGEEIENWGEAMEAMFHKWADSANSAARRVPNAMKEIAASVDESLAEMEPERAVAVFGEMVEQMGDVPIDHIATAFEKYAQVVRDAAYQQHGLELSNEQLVEAMANGAVAVQEYVGGPWTTFRYGLEEVDDAQTQAAISAAQAARQLRDLFPEYEVTGDAAFRAQEAMAAANAAAEEGGDLYAQQEAALRAAGLEMVTFSDGIEIMTAAQKAWYDMAGDSSGSFVNLLGAYDSVIDKNREVAEAAAEATGDAGKSWEDFYDGVTVGTEDFIAALEEQVAAQEEWQTNMLILSGRVSQGTLDYLTQLGPEGAQLVKDMATMTEAELAEIEELFAHSGETAGNDWARNLEGAGPILNAVATKMGAGAVEKVAEEIQSGEYTLQEIIDKYDLQATIYANADPALDAAREAMRRISEMSTTVEIRQNITRNVMGQSIAASGGYMADLAPNRLASGGQARRFPMGGMVYGPGSTTSDDIPTWLSNREFVQRAAAVDYYGVDTMYRLNRMEIPREWVQAARFNAGGYIGSAPAAQSPSLTFDMNALVAAIAQGLSNSRIYMGDRVIDARIETALAGHDFRSAVMQR